MYTIPVYTEYLIKTWNIKCKYIPGKVYTGIYRYIPTAILGYLVHGKPSARSQQNMAGCPKLTPGSCLGMARAPGSSSARNCPRAAPAMQLELPGPPQ